MFNAKASAFHVINFRNASKESEREFPKLSAECFLSDVSAELNVQLTTFLNRLAHARQLRFNQYYLGGYVAERVEAVGSGSTCH